ncbi:Holliday junction branch migration protein RuvA [Gammaproteobacteria bacterium]|jgi:Holliday junction DNA helicase RuvA|nr:Holliday junction branch migration protein RuvA [Gammaproteobacteria bacterium]|tara:strand:+ start:748 stop:1341 length:594 start_codon:yes stop_codon:yes gene_type:complete
MIARLEGELLDKQAPCVLIDVNGVGYEVNVSLNTLVSLPEIGANLALLTHFVVREDAQTLYGFISSRERELFRALIKVNGVGPKMALGILSGMTVDEFSTAVFSEDIGLLVKLPGVGKKTAERLVIEMRDIIDSVGLTSAIDSSNENKDVRLEAEGALISLGYKQQDVSKIMSKLDLKSVSTAEDIIRLALKSIAKI